MGWNSKSDVIAVMLSFGGFALVGLFAGVVAPIIFEVRRGGMFSLVMILVVFVLLCSCLIYLLRRRNQKNKKSGNS